MTKKNAPDYNIMAGPVEGYALARCPFCGRNTARLEKPNDYRVRCWTCGASSDDAPNANYVLWAWNRRTASK